MCLPNFAPTYIRSQVPGAEGLVVRIVSSVDKKLEVKPRFLEIFQEENYPLEFPYKSKVLQVELNQVHECQFRFNDLNECHISLSGTMILRISCRSISITFILKR